MSHRSRLGSLAAGTLLVALFLSACMNTAIPPSTPQPTSGATDPASAPRPTTAPVSGGPRGDGITHQPLFSIPPGPDGITFRYLDTPEARPDGPSAFTVAPDGSFWIIDVYAQRLLQYGPNGQRRAIIDLNDQQRVLLDIEVTVDAIYVLDGWPTPQEILKLALDGTRLERYALPAGYQTSAGLTGLALDDQGGLLLEIRLGESYAQALNDSGVLNPQPLPGLPYAGQVFNVQAADFNDQDADHSLGAILAGDQRIPIDLEHAVAGMQLLGFAPDGSFFVELQEMPLSGTSGVDQTVRHYAPDGRLLGMARFPLATQLTYVSQPLAVGPDGALYGLLTSREGATIVRMSFAGQLPSIFTDVAGPPIEAVFTPLDGSWRVRYPAGQLTMESLGPDLAIFIGENRANYAAVDWYVASGDEYGTTGENLRNRARDTLARIYGAPVSAIDILASPPSPWQTGLTFRTARGSVGTALYAQPGRATGDYRVYGFIFAHNENLAAEVRPMLEQMLASFEILAAPPHGDTTHGAGVAVRQLMAALHEARYADAAALFASPDPRFNEQFGAASTSEALQIMCTAGYLCLPVRSVVSVQEEQPGVFLVVVELANPDGSAFVLSPLVQGAAPRSQFPFNVRQTAAGFVVISVPPYAASSAGYRRRRSQRLRMLECAHALQNQLRIAARASGAVCAVAGLPGAANGPRRCRRLLRPDLHCGRQ